MKIKFVKNPTSAGLAYFAEDIVDVQNNELATALIDDGYAQKCENQNVKTENILPDKK